MMDSMGPGKLVRHMQNPSYTYDKYLICIGLGPSISSVICKNPSYNGPSYPSSPVLLISTHLMQLSGSFLQSMLQRNLSHASHPIGGVLARPLSSAATQDSKATTVSICHIMPEINTEKTNNINSWLFGTLFNIQMDNLL